MTKDELRKGLEAAERKRMRMVSLRLDDETVEKMKAKAAEMGMSYQAVARKVLQAAFA